MAKLFLVPINLGGNELLNAAIQNLSTAQRPANPNVGQIYFDTTINNLMIYDGTQWKAVGQEVTFGTLNTDNSTAQSVSSSESFEDTINLHKVSKTGNYNDLLNLPDLTKKADLDSNGLVPSSQLPSYVDDVVELLDISLVAPETCAKGDMYYNKTTKLIYTATATNTWSTTGETPEKGKIYLNLKDEKFYRWSGSVLAEISSSTTHKYVSTITGDGTTTTFNVSHNLNDWSPIVQVHDSNSMDLVEVDININSASRIDVTFAVAPTSTEEYEVVIMA